MLLFDQPAAPARRLATDELLAGIEAFDEFGARTVRDELTVAGHGTVPVFINEFWTAGQRQASRLHEISYRACFKPQLPRFFIERLTGPGDVVYDPFSGRGTTAIEAALLGRIPWAADINPLSRMLAEPRLHPVDLPGVVRRIEAVDFQRQVDCPEELLVFYHPETLQEICALRAFLHERSASPEWDPVDGWIRMVATNRLTGHSPGFFSVYTLPPNQATSVTAQKRINAKRNQTPPRRDVPELIRRKARKLMKERTAAESQNLRAAAARARFVTGSADATPELPDASVDLVVTSPPFLNAVDYRLDNWLRGWFCGIETDQLPIWQISSLEKWEAAMERVFIELRRLLKPGGLVAFEVGEVRHGEIRLEEHVAGAAHRAGLTPLAVLINAQEFTKTSNCWGVSNQLRGTNTNRISLLRKSGQG
ncbi:MAG: site-specific DNA-methyltransferase [Verrucomicrobiales bacterium]|nr:site-specific DNA-methyltransferase [Verrucomicrobiales bacterium]